MTREGEGLDRARLIRLGLIGAVVAVVVVAGYFAYDESSQLTRLKASLAFLIGLEFAYGVMLTVSLVGVPTLSALLIQARRRGLSRPWAARGLLLCVSTLAGLMVCEAASVVRVRRGGGAVMLPGGLQNTDSEKPAFPFPRALDLAPAPPSPTSLPESFPEAKQPDDVEIVVVGESSAAGVPYNMFSMSPVGIAVERLREEVPGKRFHLAMVADSGETLEIQQQKLARIERKPDVLVVYCGHNEFSARLPASRDIDYYSDAGEPPLWTRLADEVERFSPFCGLIRATADACRVGIPPALNANRRLVDAPVYTQAEYDAFLADFRSRLETIVSYAVRVGALPILIAPPANDADFEPNRSFLPADTPHAERVAFAGAFEAARRLEESDPAQSVRLYRKLVDRAPGFAETWFRLGRLAERAGDWDEAFQDYRAARDLDGMPMRCLTPFQDVYRDLADRHGCILIDGQAYFHAVARHGQLDDELFHDGMHPSLRGQVAIAQAVLNALHERRAFGWPADHPTPRLDPAAVARRHVLDRMAWNKICHWGIMFYDKVAQARYDSTERRAKQDAFGKAADKLAAGQSPESVGLPNIGVPRPIPPEPAAGPS